MVNSLPKKKMQVKGVSMWPSALGMIFLKDVVVSSASFRKSNVVSREVTNIFHCSHLIIV